MKRLLLALIGAFLLSAPAMAATIKDAQVSYRNGTYALAFPDYVDTRVLAADTAESITVPTDPDGNYAIYVLFSSTCDFYADYSGTAVVPSADVTDGTSNELNPTVRLIGGSVTAISVISSTAGCVITASFYM